MIPIVSALAIRIVFAVFVSGYNFCITFIIRDFDDNRIPLVFFELNFVFQLHRHISAVLKADARCACESSARYRCIVLRRRGIRKIFIDLNLYRYVFAGNADIDGFQVFILAVGAAHLRLEYVCGYLIFS